MLHRKIFVKRTTCQPGVHFSSHGGGEEEGHTSRLMMPCLVLCFEFRQQLEIIVLPLGCAGAPSAELGGDGGGSHKGH